MDFCDQIEGVLITFNDPSKVVLLIGVPANAHLPGDMLYNGQVTIRYGFNLLIERDMVIPSSAYDDFQREYRGRDALEFALSKGASYPRADLTGQRVSDGKMQDYFMRDVDIADGLQAVAFYHESSVRLDAAVWLREGVAGLIPVTEQALGLPALLQQAVSCFLLDPVYLNKLPDLLG